jgi:hypothetical protein
VVLLDSPFRIEVVPREVWSTAAWDGAAEYHLSAELSSYGGWRCSVHGPWRLRQIVSNGCGPCNTAPANCIDRRLDFTRCSDLLLNAGEPGRRGSGNIISGCASKHNVRSDYIPPTFDFLWAELALAPPASRYIAKNHEIPAKMSIAVPT